jgi:DNA-binding FadR family transcriptional regulator
MRIQHLWIGAVAAGKDGTRLSFWRRVVAAIAEGRQKKADAVVKEYLQRRAEYQDRNKR